MNRLEFCESFADVRRCPPRITPTEVETQSSPLGDAYFTPLHYEANYRYPLLIWLHGQGNSERQLARIAPGISERNFVAASLRGPVSMAAGIDGFTWQQTTRAIDVAHDGVMQLMEATQTRYNIHPDRIFLAGQGVGGTMALRLALREPTQFAGVLSLGGALPTDDAPLSNLHNARKLPVFLASGGASRRYPAEQVCRDLRLLHTAGIPLTLRHYPSGDEVYHQSLHDANEWIMETVAASGETSIIR